MYVDIRFYIRYSFLLSCWHLNISPSLTRSYHLARWRESGWVPSAICWLFWLWRTDVFHVRPAAFPSLVIFKWKFSALKPAEKWNALFYWKTDDDDDDDDVIATTVVCVHIWFFFRNLLLLFHVFIFWLQLWYNTLSWGTHHWQITTDRACKRLRLRAKEATAVLSHRARCVIFCSISGLLGRCHLPHQ